MKTVSVKLNTNTYKELQEEAESDGSTLSDVVRDRIENNSNLGSSYDMKESPPLAVAPKEIIKEVIKEVPKIEYRDRPIEKIVRVPQPYPVEKIVEKRNSSQLFTVLQLL